jgi:MFS family permease
MSQKDIAGGLYWEQSRKGILFFVWALFQNLIPFVAGGFADRYGSKKTMFASFILIIAGYYLFGTQRDFIPFLLAAIVLGTGIGIMRPALQGGIAGILTDSNSSLGWGIYAMMINGAIFIIGPFVIGFLKGFSWQMLFFGCAVIFSLNYLLLIFFREGKAESHLITKPKEVFVDIVKTLFQARVAYFVLIMSGFTIIYMQFYETLPNFIIDWVDTSDAGSFLTGLGIGIDGSGQAPIEWIYAFCSGLIVIGIIPLSWLLTGANRLIFLIAGMLTVTIGILISGISQIGNLTMLGMIIYTIGEMITNPKFNEFTGRLAPEGKKSLYMGYLYISWAIGLGSGSLMGGWLYQYLGEKAYLSRIYLEEHLGYSSYIAPQNAFNLLQSKLALDPTQATKLLWSTYQPYQFWLIFFIIGLLSSLGLYLYSKRYGNSDKISI